jgi:hypothetical protein
VPLGITNHLMRIIVASLEMPTDHAEANTHAAALSADSWMAKQRIMTMHYAGRWAHWHVWSSFHDAKDHCSSCDCDNIV